MKKIILLLLISLPVYSQVPKVSSGQAITAEQMNKIIDQLVPIGTVYHSLLTPSQFLAINGNCWKLMDSSSSLVGTDLGTLTNKTSLPPAVTNGAFLRQITGSRELGSYEADENKSHSHTQNATAYNVNSAIGGIYFRNTDKISAGIDTAIGNTAYYTVKTNAMNAEGGAEAKPKNIGVNLFVKVNKVCNL